MQPVSEPESGTTALSAGQPASPCTPADAASRTIAAQIRRERPRWVVIWSPRKHEYQARPLFRAPRRTVAAATSRRELNARMDEIEQSARLSRAAQPTGQATLDDIPVGRSATHGSVPEGQAIPE